MNFTPPERPGLPNRRKLLWLVFWFVFIATPVLVVAGSAILKHLPVPQLPTAILWLSFLASSMAGSTMSGLLLARLTNEDRVGFIRQGIGYSFAFTLLHLMVVLALLTLV